jgi:hypothetical protein
MPAKRSRRPRIAKARRLARLNRTDVTRAEYNRIIDILNERKKILDGLADAITALHHDSDIQFRRIAQIQADLDDAKSAWKKMTLHT